MTEAQKANGADAQQPVFSLVSQYARDLSFECPHGPHKAHGTEKDMNLEIGLGMRGVGENLHEVSLRLRGAAKNNDGDELYVVELDYVGTFHIESVPQEKIGALLGIDGAAIIFPFARQIAMTTIEFGGFRAPLIEPVNFAHLYMQAQQQQAQQQPQAAQA